MANELMSMPLDEAIPLTRACGVSSFSNLGLLNCITGRQAMRQLRRRPLCCAHIGFWYAGHYLNLTQIAETHHR